MTGFAFGGFMTYMVSGQIAVQPELLYMMKGAEWEGELETWKGKYNYLEIPILFKYIFSAEGTTKPNLFVGPSVGILLSASEEGVYDGDPYDYDAKDWVKSTDFGLTAGAGVTMAMGDGVLTIDARYTMGLSKVYEPDPDFPDEGSPDIKSKVISFMVGYGF